MGSSFDSDEEYERVGREIYGQIKESGTGRIELHMRCKDGHNADVFITGTAIDPDDWDKGITFTVMDVTERKKAQQALEFTQFAVDHFSESAFWMGPDARFIYVNEAACRFMEYTKEELLTMGVQDIDPDFPAEVWSQHWQKLKEKGTLVFESRHKTRDGRIIPVEITANFVAFEGKEYNCAFARDISKRKEAERALRFTQFAVEHVGVPAFWMDSELKYFYVNEAACKSLGYTRQELLTMSVYDIDPLFTQQMAAETWDLMKKYGPQTFEACHKTKDGKIFPVEVTANLLNYEGTEYNCAFAVDITERKAYENARERLLKELRAKNEELESIVFIASHDLRSPLVNIEGFTGEVKKACGEVHRLLQQVQSPKDVQKQLDYLLGQDIPESIGFITTGTSKMDTLLSGLLRLSRIGTATIHIEPVNMNMLLQTVIGAMRFQIRELKIEIRVEDLPNCSGDAVQVNQVFSNLIDNAIKYRHPDRTGRIEITGTVKDNEVVYAVTDNGIGIDPQHHEKIFEIFHQLNPDSKTRGEGLGLTIIRRILDRLDGKVWVRSNVDQGSTFYISLPRSQ